jgi:hypothetical protein
VDETGVVFMDADYRNDAGAAAAQLIKFDAETGAVIPFQTDAGAVDFIDATDSLTTTSIGVGIDADGDPWVNNYSGNAMRVNKTTGAITRTAQQKAGLYTYSDFTGYQLRKFTAPRGTFKKDMTGCDPQTTWRSVTWDAEVPANTRLQLYVKVANTLADLNNSATTRYGPFELSPADLVTAGVPKGHYLRVEFVLLSSNGKSTPVLKSFNVVWQCGGIN